MLAAPSRFHMRKLAGFQLFEGAADRHCRVSQDFREIARSRVFHVPEVQVAQEECLRCRRQLIFREIAPSPKMFSEVHRKLRNEELVSRHYESRGLLDEAAALIGG